jgi:hypothetical protein
MTFVPPPTFVPPRNASLEAQDLAREIEGTIVDFQKRRTRLSRTDIRQAMSIVAERTGVGGVSRERAVRVIALLLGLLLAFGLGLGIFFVRG